MSGMARIRREICMHRMAGMRKEIGWFKKARTRSRTDVWNGDGDEEQPHLLQEMPPASESQQPEQLMRALWEHLEERKSDQQREKWQSRANRR